MLEKLSIWVLVKVVPKPSDVVTDPGWWLTWWLCMRSMWWLIAIC